MFGPDFWMPGPEIKRKEQEIGLEGGRHLNGGINLSWNRHLSFVPRALHHNKIQITTLDLHEYRQMLVIQIFPVPVMRQLKTLILSFRYECEESIQFTNMDESKEPKWRVAPYLAGAENSTTLAMARDFKPFRPSFAYMHGQEKDCAWIGLFPILTDAHWPKLRIYHLYTVLLQSSS
ncbi:hypothetical protein N7G274_006574 [Stereocaulon virgatum]|uniref:Uncharacterized protein n=1 Tax=Stereocaulon virgatum TaxID=373712 RepID=A0ABR4A405_9LECA